MWEYLIEIDYKLFSFINQSLSWDFLDRVMPLWRSKYFWIPLYVFLLAMIAQSFGKKSWIVFIGIAITIFFADTTSSKLIKKNIKRTRPCNTEWLSEQINVVVHCGSGYSFTSSHATNHFALATYLIMTLGFFYRRLKWWLIVWAGSIAFGQVYVGVHFPSDVVAGSLVGILLGGFVGWIVRKRLFKDKPKMTA